MIETIFVFLGGQTRERLPLREPVNCAYIDISLAYNACDNTHVCKRGHRFVENCVHGRVCMKDPMWTFRFFVDIEFGI